MANLYEQIQKEDLYHSIELVDPIEHPNLYLRLILVILKASNPENAEQYKVAFEKTCYVYTVEFLDNKGKNYATRLQLITRLFAKFLINAGKPMHGVGMIGRAIRIMRSSNEQVSSLHTQYAMLCLSARCFQHSLAVIEHPITSVMSGTNPLEICTYNFYRGMIYMGLERYADAIECYRKVLSQPAAMAHQVHIDSYQRVSLLNLIVHGQSFNAKAAGVGAVVNRHIEFEENRRLQQEGIQSVQDGAWMEEVGAAGGGLFESPNKWHGDLINAWESNSTA